MGGPINGAKNGVIVPTTIQTSADILAYWMGMTCVYDVQWVPEYGRVTLPISMFHVTSIREICDTEISTKRVILYEPQSSETAQEMAKKVRPSILRTVVDNAVRAPRMYSLEIALPFKPVDRRMQDFAGVLSGAMGMFSSLLGLDGVNDTLYRMSSANKEVIELATKVVDTMSRLPSMNDISYVNKSSLDAMWERTHLLCMKMWTGYDYKFVLIKSLEVSKKATEDDVFRATMQVQEMNVLSANRPSGSTRINNVSSNPAVNIMSKTERALSDILVLATGVGKATGVYLDAASMK